MAKRTVLKPLAWMSWKGVVEVAKVETPGFYSSAYEVFQDGVSVGFVLSRAEFRHATLWTAAKSLSAEDLRQSLGWNTSRALAADVLVEQVPGR